jgi:hypothetical protein
MANPAREFLSPLSWKEAAFLKEAGSRELGPFSEMELTGPLCIATG